MNVVAVTACPTGVAHCEMAAERLCDAAPDDVVLEVEIRGAGGPKGELSEARIEEADVAVLATDIRVDTERFDGIPTVTCGTDDAIRDADAVFERSREAAGDV